MIDPLSSILPYPFSFPEEIQPRPIYVHCDKSICYTPNPVEIYRNAEIKVLFLFVNDTYQRQIPRAGTEHLGARWSSLGA